MRDFVVVEPTFRDGQHAAVNAGLVASLLLCGSCDRVRLFATAEHWAALRDILTTGQQDAIRFTPIEVGAPGGVRTDRFVRQTRTLLAATRRPSAGLLCLSSGPETFFAARLVAHARPGLTVRIVLHGNLVDAVATRSRDPRRRLVDYVAGLRATRHTRIGLIALEPAIRRAMAAHRVPGWERTWVVPHPLNEAEFTDGAGPQPGAPVTLGFIGHAKRTKGFGDFLALARSARRPGLRFVLVGFLAEAFPPEALGEVSAPGTALSRPDFVRALTGITYGCFPFSASTYAWTASGSLLDAACALRPVVAIGFGALEDAVREFGPLGHVHADMDEMTAATAVPGALTDTQAYAGFQENLRRFRAARTPAALGAAMAAVWGHNAPAEVIGSV